MNDASKDIIFYICNMLDKRDILNCRLLSTKINGHMSKYIYKKWIFMYDDNFIKIFKEKDICNLEFKQKFNKDISGLAGLFPHLTSLHLGNDFNQDISGLAGSFAHLASLDLGF